MMMGDGGWVWEVVYRGGGAGRKVLDLSRAAMVVCGWGRGLGWWDAEGVLRRGRGLSLSLCVGPFPPVPFFWSSPPIPQLFSFFSSLSPRSFPDISVR